ncbi:hypothetical protein SFRURICE_013037, partial [Spodoptera frugiperda]
VLTSLNCTLPASPNSETDVYAASGWMKSWHRAISSLRNMAPILVLRCEVMIGEASKGNMDVWRKYLNGGLRKERTVLRKW